MENEQAPSIIKALEGDIELPINLGESQDYTLRWNKTTNWYDHIRVNNWQPEDPEGRLASGYIPSITPSFILKRPEDIQREKIRLLDQAARRNFRVPLFFEGAVVRDDQGNAVLCNMLGSDIMQLPIGNRATVLQYLQTRSSIDYIDKNILEALTESMKQPVGGYPVGVIPPGPPLVPPHILPRAPAPMQIGYGDDFFGPDAPQRFDANLRVDIQKQDIGRAADLDVSMHSHISQALSTASKRAAVNENQQQLSLILHPERSPSKQSGSTDRPQKNISIINKDEDDDLRQQSRPGVLEIPFGSQIDFPDTGDWPQTHVFQKRKPGPKKRGLETTEMEEESQMDISGIPEPERRRRPEVSEQQQMKMLTLPPGLAEDEEERALRIQEQQAAIAEDEEKLGIQALDIEVVGRPTRAIILDIVQAVVQQNLPIKYSQIDDGMYADLFTIAADHRAPVFEPNLDHDVKFSRKHSYNIFELQNWGRDTGPSIFEMLDLSPYGTIQPENFQSLGRQPWWTLNERESMYARWFFSKHAYLCPSIFQDTFYASQFNGPIVNQTSPEYLKFFPPEWVQETSTDPTKWYETPPYAQFIAKGYERGSMGRIMLFHEAQGRLRLVPGFIIGAFVAELTWYQNEQIHLAQSDQNPKTYVIITLQQLQDSLNKIKEIKSSHGNVGDVKFSVSRFHDYKQQEQLQNGWWIPYFDSVMPDGGIKNSLGFGHLLNFIYSQYKLILDDEKSYRMRRFQQQQRGRREEVNRDDFGMNLGGDELESPYRTPRNVATPFGEAYQEYDPGRSESPNLQNELNEAFIEPQENDENQ